VQHVGRIDEVDDADLLGGPEVLPPSAERVLALGQELVEVFCERVAASPWLTVSTTIFPFLSMSTLVFTQRPRT
jgi:hypothetical protein